MLFILRYATSHATSKMPLNSDFMTLRKGRRRIVVAVRMHSPALETVHMHACARARSPLQHPSDDMPVVASARPAQSPEQVLKFQATCFLGT